MDITQRKITKIAREANRFTVRTLRAEGFGISEFDVLHVIRHNPGTTQAEICQKLGLDKGSVARQVSNLEAKGYVVRADNPADGRSRLLHATEKAEGLKHSKAQVETAFYEWLTEELSEADRAEFSRLLDVLYRRSKAESKADFPNLSARMAALDPQQQPH